MQTRAPSQRLCSPTKAKLARDGKTMARFFPPPDKKYSTSSARTVRTSSTRALVAETIRRMIRSSSDSNELKGRTRTTRGSPTGTSFRYSPLSVTNGNKEVNSKIKSTTTQEFTRPPPTPKNIQEDNDDGQKEQNIQKDTIFIASENYFQSSPNDVLPSITSPDASSTVGPMSDIVPPIDDENSLSDFVGYDSLADKAKNRTHAKIMTNTDDNSPPVFDFQQKKQIPKEGKDNKNTARTDQRAGLSQILARHQKVAHEILYKTDYHSLSTDDDFPPPPIKSTILSDEASFISAITFDNTHAQQHNTINSENRVIFPKSKHHDLAQGERIEGNDRKEAVQLNHSDYVLAESMKRSERVRKSARAGGKVLNLQNENLSLKEMNLQLMMQLSTRRQGNKKQHQYDARRLKDISNKVARTSSQSENSELKKVHVNLLTEMESTTTTENPHKANATHSSLDRIRQLLEKQNAQMLRQLQDVELLRAEAVTKIAELQDVELVHAEAVTKIAELQATNSQQEASIALFRQQLEESNQSMNEKLIKLRQHYEEERIGFRAAHVYNNLLKRQLSKLQ